MQLPDAHGAVIALEKITEYLLSDVHPEGRGKAAFFRRNGFRREEPLALRSALLHLARHTDMSESVFAFGKKYVGSGELRCPDGRMVPVVTVWVLRGGQPPPYFVTAYPA